MLPEQDVLNSTRQHIDETLLPLVLLNREKADLSLDDFSIDVLPVTATIVCKFAALMVQAYWLEQKSITRDESRTDLRLPPRLDDIVSQLWAGHQTHTNAFALSILHTASLSPDSSLISRLVNNPRVIVRWTKLIKLRKAQYRAFEQELDSDDWYLRFKELLQALPVLNAVKYENHRLQLRLLGEKVWIPEFPFLHFPENSLVPRYLRGFSAAHRDHSIQFEDPLKGIPIDSALETNDDRERYRAIRTILGAEEVPERIVYLFGGGYEHIQRLAEAIADVDTGSNRARALDKIKKEHCSEYREIDPDKFTIDFVTLLIADKGPNCVAHEVLDDNPTLLDEYLVYFQNNGLGEASKWRAEMEHQIATRKAHIREYLRVDPDYRASLERKLEKEIRVWCLTAAAGLQSEEPPTYVESINLHLRMFKSWSEAYWRSKEGNDEISLVLGDTNKISERIFKFLILFYRGVQAYHESMNADSRYVAGNHDKHEKRMLEAISQLWDGNHYPSLRRMSTGMLVGQFREVLRDFNGSAIVKTLFGRDTLLDLSVYEQLTGPQDSESAWVTFFNRQKHDLPPVESDEMPSFMEKTKAILKTFRYGYAGVSDEIPYTLEPIYPMVISFRELHRNRDGMLVYSYELSSIDEQPMPSAADQKERAISIITPREYIPNEEYYCIPHRTRSTKKWWLEPFLVRCSSFDKVLQG